MTADTTYVEIGERHLRDALQAIDEYDSRGKHPVAVILAMRIIAREALSDDR